MICYVYSPEPVKLIGVVDKISDQYFEDAYADAGKFGFWCPLKYKSILEEDNIVWFGGVKAGIVESVSLKKSDNGHKQLEVTGHTAEIYLDRRTIYPTFVRSGYAGNVICDLVSENLVRPDDQDRAIYSVSLQFPTTNLGSNISYQQTGGNLLNEVSALCQANFLDFHLRFDPDSARFVFEIFAVTNRSVNQQAVSPVTIASSLDDILSSSYYSSTENWKNFAYIAGEGTGSDRRYATLETVDQVCSYQRRELFVDARDIQSENGDTTISPAEYTGMLVQRGSEKLTNFKRVQRFEATIRNNPRSYVYGVDYFIGDTVTVVDEDLGVTIDAVVVKATSSKTQGKEETEISLGYGVPTIYKRMKGVIM